MKAAKQRYYKKIPEFWKVLSRDLNDGQILYKVKMVHGDGTFYCPYIPLMKYEPKYEADKEN